MNVPKVAKLVLYFALAEVFLYWCIYTYVRLRSP